MADKEGEWTELDEFKEIIQDGIDELNNRFSDPELAKRLCFRHGDFLRYPAVSSKDLQDFLSELLNIAETTEFRQVDDFYSELKEINDIWTRWINDALGELCGSYGKDVVNNFLILHLQTKRIFDNYATKTSVGKLQSILKQESTKIDALTDRVNQQESRAGNITEVLDRILEADRAAARLPVTKRSLDEAESIVSEIANRSRENDKSIEDIRARAVGYDKHIKEAHDKVDELLRRCDMALASSTSAGLAASFDIRKKELQKYGGMWAGVLILALVSAVGAIWYRADAIAQVLALESKMSLFALFANFIVSIGFIGCPIWLAWLATKQIGYYFRLSEDYAFKASVSASYEGFRREASRQDAELEKRVLESTLDRYDEAPLRFVDKQVAGSPIHELLSNQSVLEALKKSPDFVKKVIEQADQTLKIEENIGKKLPDLNTKSE